MFGCSAAVACCEPAGYVTDPSGFVIDPSWLRTATPLGLLLQPEITMVAPSAQTARTRNLRLLMIVPRLSSDIASAPQHPVHSALQHNLPYLTATWPSHSSASPFLGPPERPRRHTPSFESLTPSHAQLSRLQEVNYSTHERKYFPKPQSSPYALCGMQAAACLS